MYNYQYTCMRDYYSGVTSNKPFLIVYSIINEGNSSKNGKNSKDKKFPTYKATTYPSEQ